MRIALYLVLVGVLGWLVLGSLVTGWVVWLCVVLVVGLGLSVGGFEDEAFDRVMEPVNSRT